MTARTHEDATQGNYNITYATKKRKRAQANNDDETDPEGMVVMRYLGYSQPAAPTHTWLIQNPNTIDHDRDCASLQKLKRCIRPLFQKHYIA